MVILILIAYSTADHCRRVLNPTWYFSWVCGLYVTTGVSSGYSGFLPLGENHPPSAFEQQGVRFNRKRNTSIQKYITKEGLVVEEHRLNWSPSINKVVIIIIIIITADLLNSHNVFIWFLTLSGNVLHILLFQYLSLVQNSRLRAS